MTDLRSCNDNLQSGKRMLQGQNMAMRAEADGLKQAAANSQVSICLLLAVQLESMAKLVFVTRLFQSIGEVYIRYKQHTGMCTDACM